MKINLAAYGKNELNLLHEAETRQRMVGGRHRAALYGSDLLDWKKARFVQGRASDEISHSEFKLRRISP